jgi:hypothetical protein
LLQAGPELVHIQLLTGPHVAEGGRDNSYKLRL